MIDKNFIEKVKSALNIVNVIEQFTHLYKAGVNYKGWKSHTNLTHPVKVF